MHQPILSRLDHPGLLLAEQSDTVDIVVLTALTDNAVTMSTTVAGILMHTDSTRSTVNHGARYTVRVPTRNMCHAIPTVVENLTNLILPRDTTDLASCLKADFRIRIRVWNTVCFLRSRLRKA